MAGQEGSVARPYLSIPRGSRLPLLVYVAGGLVAFSGLIFLILSLFIGPAAFDSLWVVEPLAYIGSVLLILGLAICAAGLAALAIGASERNGKERTEGEQGHQWSDTTRQIFELVDHDLGRPMRRIAGKERELRAVLQASQSPMDPSVIDLLDEIARQTPNFRLMLSNVQVLVQLEAPGGPMSIAPVEPSEVVRRITDRYTPVAAEGRKEISWWAEPPDFGIFYADASAIDHIVTNLVDNAIRYAHTHVEVRLTKEDSRFFIQVRDDGPGIGAHYVEHVFGRGWTPEMARREEKTSSGLGLFIARTLAQRAGGELTVETVEEPDANSYTAFLLELPANGS